MDGPPSEAQVSTDRPSSSHRFSLVLNVIHCSHIARLRKAQDISLVHIIVYALHYVCQKYLTCINIHSPVARGRFSPTGAYLAAGHSTNATLLIIIPAPTSTAAKAQRNGEKEDLLRLIKELPRRGSFLAGCTV